jgi:hypothetical protein
MAGSGYKLYATGDILTAAQVNNYLQEQTVMVFADAAARTTALASVLAEGMISYLKDTDVTQYYSGSAWVTVGGTASPLTTKGDLYGYSTTNARVAVGTNGQVLTADSTAATGVAWATPATGGMTLLSTTSLSGASTTISSISGSYKDLIVYAKDWYSSSNANVLVTVNGDTTASNYQSWYSGSVNGNTVSTYGENNNVGFSMDGIGSHNGANNDNFSVIYLPDYANTTTRKVFTCTSGYVNATGKTLVNSSTYYSGTVAALSSMRFLVTVGSWSGGSVLIYGVN